MYPSRARASRPAEPGKGLGPEPRLRIGIRESVCLRLRFRFQDHEIVCFSMCFQRLMFLLWFFCGLATRLRSFSG